MLEKVFSIINSSKNDQDKEKELCECYSDDFYVDTYIDSYFINQKCNQKILDGMFERILRNDDISYQTVYFLLGQINAFIFRHSEYNSVHNYSQLQKLLEKSLDLCKKELNMDLARIPEEELNGDVQVVITQQFLTGMHGPTTTALDRCVTIKKSFGEVFLINTADSMSLAGECQLWEEMVPNYNVESLYEEYKEWKGVKIPFFQCEKNSMPDVEVIRLLLNQIISLKPKVVVAIGGGGLLEGLVNMCIPVLAVGLSVPGPTISLCDFQTVGDKSNTQVMMRSQGMGMKMEGLIETRFTYSLRQKTASFSRKDLNIPDEVKRVAVIVGWRLDYEIDEDFLNLLSYLNEKKDLFYLFVGDYSPSDDTVNKYSRVFKNAVFTGPQKELAAIMETCDLFLNPYRTGGGTSAAEAMNAKVPVLSIDYGDIAALIPKDLRCKNFEDMAEMAMRMLDDEEYYSKIVETEYQNIQNHLDSEREFIRVLNEYLAKRKSR